MKEDVSILILIHTQKTMGCIQIYVVFMFIVTDEALLAMHAVFGGVLERSLLLVDKTHSVVELQSPGGRRLLQITGSAQGMSVEGTNQLNM